MSKLFSIVAIEGIDGTGKSTICEMLKYYEFKSKICIGNIVSLYTEEPRKKGPYRKALLENKLDPLSQLILVTADRYEHINIFNNIIKNKDMHFERLITDRYNDSTWVYQVILGGVDKEKFHKFEETFEIQQPDLVILLDLDPKIAMERINNRNDEKNHFDDVLMDKKKLMRKGYLDRAIDGKSRGTQYAIIDATMSIDIIFHYIVNILSNESIFTNNVGYTIDSQSEEYVNNCLSYLEGKNDEFVK